METNDMNSTDGSFIEMQKWEIQRIVQSLLFRENIGWTKIIDNK